MLSYAPWAVMCYTGFIFAWIYGFTDTFIFTGGEPTGAEPSLGD